MDEKKWKFYNDRKTYAPLMELTTHILKSKDFYNQIKTIYLFWDVQPNLENNNQISSIDPNIIITQN